MLLRFCGKRLRQKIVICVLAFLRLHPELISAQRIIIQNIFKHIQYSDWATD